MISIFMLRHHIDTHAEVQSCVRTINRRYVPTRKNAWTLSLPSWITSKVLELGGMRAPSGWNWMLRTYNVVPIDSKVYSFVRDGDIKSLQDLFASGEASPFDQFISPYDPLLTYELLQVSIESKKHSKS
jgi:hypothetical protein